MDIPDTIDLDEGTIQLDGQWFTVEDIKRVIKQKIEEGDYDVAKHAQALKTLEPIIKATVVLEVKVLSDIANGFETISSKSGERQEKWIRKALTTFLRTDPKATSILGIAPEAAPPMAEGPEPEGTKEEAPVPEEAAVGAEEPAAPKEGAVAAVGAEEPAAPKEGAVAAVGAEEPAAPEEGAGAAVGAEEPAAPEEGAVAGVATPTGEATSEELSEYERLVAKYKGLASAPAKEGGGSAPKVITCRECGAEIMVPYPERQLTAQCPKCGTRNRVT